MGRKLIIGGSLGVAVGVLIATIGGTALAVQVLFQAVFCMIAGLLLAVCVHLLTRKNEEGESFTPTRERVTESKGGSVLNR